MASRAAQQLVVLALVPATGFRQPKRARQPLRALSYHCYRSAGPCMVPRTTWQLRHLLMHALDLPVLGLPPGLLSNGEPQTDLEDPMPLPFLLTASSTSVPPYCSF